jgi:hypothetical protein
MMQIPIPPPLTWRRSTFYVPVKPPGENETIPYPVSGIVSGPFGIFRGDSHGPDRSREKSAQYSLVLPACGRFLSTCATQGGCRVLAEELAVLDVAWTAEDVNEVTGPGIETARWLLKASLRGIEL